MIAASLLFLSILSCWRRVTK